MSLSRWVNGYMYSIPSPCRSKAASTSARPPGRSGTSMASRSVTLTTMPAFSSTSLARCQSLTTSLRMPNCWVSASDMVRMSIPASPSAWQGARSWPGRFSRKSDSWRIFMVWPPAGRDVGMASARFASVTGCVTGQAARSPDLW